MFTKILIANRGEIACRVITSAQQLGIRCVAVYSDADQYAKHVQIADEAWHIGPPAAADSYLNIDRILEVAQQSGAEAIHPGYGFLSENPSFVDACKEAGIRFIGPSADAIRAMGLKDAAKQLMEQAGVPVVPGYHGEQQDPDFLAQQAQDIGYPVLIKARAGGGGKGMRLVEQAADFLSALASAQREAESSFGDGRVLIEKFITSPRHIEVQVFGDDHGNAVHLFERDCSLQRRHQKVIEEAPAPGMTDAMRQAMGDAAVRAARAVDYSGAGTVEFIVDGSEGLQPDRFWFMEMNTRLQVEHPVTEAITGIDLVAWQLRVASGQPLPQSQADISLRGHAFEARIYAEDAEKGFMPAIGTLSHLSFPAQCRVDSGVRQGDTVTPYYDPMIAKLTVHAEDRSQALNALRNALNDCHVDGCIANVGFLHRLASHAGFIAGEFDTGLIERDLDALIRVEQPDQRLTAIAAMASCGLLSQPTGDDAWETLSGWRQWSEAKQFTHLLWRDESITCQVVSHHSGEMVVSFDDNTLHVEVIDASADQYRLRCGDELLTMRVLQSERTVTLFREGQTHRFFLPDQLSDLDNAGVAENTILSPMPGKIVSVSVNPGDTLSEGDAVMVMEAMKMEHTLCAPRDGVVAEIPVTEGDQISEGTLMLRMETET